MFPRLFNWKKEKDNNAVQPPSSRNWAFLGADMHSHFIPGIDDGAKTIDDSLALIKAMKDMGYKTIITTPHVMVDYYPNTRATILNGLATVQNALAANNIEITLKAAAEYYIDESFMNLLETEPLLTIHKNEVLVEFSMMYEPPMLFDTIFKLQTAGYKPIIAHPERYLFFHRNFRRYHELKEKGCLLQMNMLSVTGHYGKHIKAVAEDLLEQRLYDYCGSDMHHDRHAAALQSLAVSKDYQVFVNYPFLNSRLCC